MNTKPRKTLNTCGFRAFSTQFGCGIIKMSADFNSFLAFLVLESADFLLNNIL